MAVSRRLRFEILRRDNHQCRYCGASAPDTKLTVDHVVPTALGGSDEPGNLVTACTQCNSGKSSSSPDAPIVDDVRSDALRWARAIEVVSHARLADREARDAYVEQFDEAWSRWTYPTYKRPDPVPSEVMEKWVEIAGELTRFVTPIAINSGTLYVQAKSAKRQKETEQREDELVGGMFTVDVFEIQALGPYQSAPSHTIKNHLPRPSGWQVSIWNFYATGLAIDEVLDAVQIACSARNVHMDSVFRYFCGVCWKKIEEIREAASDVVLTLEEG